MSFKEVFFIYIYRFLINPLALSFTFLVLWPLNKKVAEGLMLRKTLFKKLKATHLTGAIWIHASSGEFEYAKSVIRSLKEKNANQRIIVTYFSPTYKKAIEQFNGVDLAVPLPLDLPKPVSEFLDIVKPQALLIARTDLWPELLYQVKKRGIPSLLFSATFKEQNILGRLFNFYRRFLLNMLSRIFVVSKTDLANLSIIKSSTHASDAGDTRYDQVIYRIDHMRPLNTQALDSVEVPILIAGSTWPEDENALFHALEQLLKQNIVKLLLVPHEPTESHLNDIESRLSDYGLSFSRFSQATSFNTHVIVVDRIGILAELYTHSDIAFIGGSFKSKVHSVMEALAAGLPVIVGPHHTNNREAIEFQKLPISDKLAAVTATHNSANLKLSLQRIINDLKLNAHLGDKIKNEVISRSGGSLQVVEWIDNLKR